jgi:2-polyprenyl-6-methoxyphenol hydroxylase-like FAD-dependent oxidoreductase
LAAPGYYFLTTDTPQVMRWLAEQLRLHGVDLRLGTSFTDCARIGTGWQVDGVGSTRYLVGADGARSRVAQRCGLGEVRAVPLRDRIRISRRAPRARRCPALLHQQALRTRPHRLDHAEPDWRAGGLALRHDPERARVPTSTASCWRGRRRRHAPALRPGTRARD